MILPLEAARETTGASGKIIGYSASNVEEAAFGEKHGADYLGGGTRFFTRPVRPMRGEPIGVDGLKLIKESV